MTWFGQGNTNPYWTTNKLHKLSLSSATSTPFSNSLKLIFLSKADYSCLIMIRMIRVLLAQFHGLTVTTMGLERLGDTRSKMMADAVSSWLRRKTLRKVRKSWFRMEINWPITISYLIMDSFFLSKLILYPKLELKSHSRSQVRIHSEIQRRNWRMVWFQIIT